jgi:hypothetical protein
MKETERGSETFKKIRRLWIKSKIIVPEKFGRFSNAKNHIPI